MISGTRPDLPATLAAGSLAVIAFWVWVSAAADERAGDAMTLDLLMSRLASAAGTSVRFREEKTFSFLVSPLVSYGRLRVEAPDKLVRETGGPGGTRYVVSSSSLVVEEPGKASREMRLDDIPALRGLMETMRALFTGNLSLLNRLYWISFDTDGDLWTLDLAPREEGITKFVSKIRVTGQDARIRTIETLEAGGDRVLMTILHDG